MREIHVVWIVRLRVFPVWVMFGENFCPCTLNERCGRYVDFARVLSHVQPEELPGEVWASIAVFGVYLLFE
jgi:hypothetical protein